MYSQYGSDDTVWEDKLALQMNLGGIFYCFFIDNEDFEVTVPQFIGRLQQQVVLALGDPRSQRGVAQGQFIP
jgi:hypothetical protein